MGRSSVDQAWKQRALATRNKVVPLTAYQKRIAQLLAVNRTPDSHLAGGAALHSSADSIRYSEDLDYFHDSDVRVASAYEQDSTLLISHGYDCPLEMNQRGYIRCVVKKGSQSTKVEWARDTAWRFFPAQADVDFGYVLHPIDLAINKLLALVGRDEPRDYLDVLVTHEKVLSLGAQLWAACGKDPGYTPHGLLELLKRRGRYRPEDFQRLHLHIAVDVKELKQKWLRALEEAEKFVEGANPSEIGCLFFSKSKQRYVQPELPVNKEDTTLHFGRLGGVVPTFVGPGDS